MTPKQRTHDTSYRFETVNRLRAAVNDFLLDCDARNLTPATLRFYWQRLGGLVAFLEGRQVTDPQSITAEHVRAFLAAFSDRGRSPYYTHQHYRALKTFCGFLVREGVLGASFMRTVRAPKLPKDVLPPFDAGEVHDLLEACTNDRDRALILTLLDCGVRVSELLALNVGNLDLTTGALRVIQGKGRKDRVTFVGPRTRKAIAQYLAGRRGAKPDDPLFVMLDSGTRIAFFGLQSLLRRRGQAADVHPMGAHRFRRTFAIESLRAGMPLPQLAALMEHEDLQVLQRYLRLVDDDLRAAHEQHGAVEREAGQCPSTEQYRARFDLVSSHLAR